jgi:cytochrome c551/c552
VRGGERSQQLLELDFAERIILDGLQVSLVLVVGRSGRHGLAVGVEERWVCVDCRANVAGVVDLSTVGRAARSVEAAFSGELRTALEFVATVCEGGSGAVVVGV